MRGLPLRRCTVGLFIPIASSSGTVPLPKRCTPRVTVTNVHHIGRSLMGRGILLWLLGVPIPVIILLALIWH